MLGFPLGILSAAAILPPAPAEPAYEHIATAVPSGVTDGVTSVTFSSIPQDYKHLQIRYVAKSTGASNVNMIVNFNNNTSSVYARHYLRGSAATASSVGAGSVTTIQMLFSVARSTIANACNAGVLDIVDYSSTTKNTTLRGLYGSDENSAVVVQSGLFNNTGAITTIKLDNGAIMNSISRFSLYGIRGE